MALATGTPSPEMHPDLEAPPPLEFFRKDAIHEDNRALLEHEQQRWRLLGFWERIRLRLYVGSLARQLRRGKYNPTVLQLHKVREEFRRALDAYRTTTYISDEARAQARGQILELKRAGEKLLKRYSALKSVYASYQHYAGWLEYEQAHRRELKAEDRREKRIRSEMRAEARWIEKLLLDVFRKTKGCHHIEKSDKGKERTRTPKFERSIITPDAHYFYLAASRRTLLGWRWRLPYGVTISRLTEDEVLENMRAATKRQVHAIWSETGQLMFRVSRLDSPDALPREVKWRDAMRFFPENKRDKLPYTIGVSESRKFRWFDLTSDPHVLVAGKSQSGKSNLVNGIIASLVSTHSPDELRIVLVDQKGGIEFTHWQEIPHLLWDVVKTVDGVEPVLARLVTIMRQRMAALEKAKAKDIDAYNKRVDAPYRMARVLVVIDEMNTFVGLGQKTEEIHNQIMLLVSQGRAVGVHVIASTQHPEVKVIPGRIKTNMSVRLSGAMPTVSASLIVLDNPEAARLPNIPGRFVAVVGLQNLIVQVPRILDKDIAGVVSSCKRQYADVSENLSDVGEQPKLVIWDEQRVMIAALEWLEGQLSGEKLHKMLGAESPGERHLKRACRRLVDEAAAVGYVERGDDQSKWVIKRRGRAYYLTALSVTSDEASIPRIAATAPDQSSE